MNKIITLLILFSTFIGTTKIHALNNGDDFVYNNITYTVISKKEGTCRTKAAENAGGNNHTEIQGEITIPSEIRVNDNEVYTVVEIGDFSFAETLDLSGVTFPKTLLKIGKGAFRNSSISNELKLPESLEEIGHGAFYHCVKLTGNLNIPNSVKIIEEFAFAWCSGFDGKLVIGENVETIGPSAFLSCNKLTGSLDIPSSVTSIGYSAFNGCSGFTGDLFLPASLQNIGTFCFNDTNFKSVFSHAEEPPIIDGEENDKIDESHCFSNYNIPLYVPKESVQKYQEAYCWELFNTIQSLESLNLTLKLGIEDFDIKAGETKEIPVNITVEGEADDFKYIGFQFIITAPEGLKITEVKFADGLKNFETNFANITGQTATVKCSATDASKFSDILEGFLTLVVEADKNVEDKSTENINVSDITFTSESNDQISCEDSECKVTFINIPVTGFTFTDDKGDTIDSDSDIELYVDDTYVITIGVEPAEATIKDFTCSVTQTGNIISDSFEESSNKLTLTGLNFGDATLKVSSDTYKVTETLSVKVVQKEIEKIVISRKDNEEIIDHELLMTPGQEIELTASVTPEQKYTGATVKWESNDPSIVKVDESTGKITTLSDGKATVTVTASNDKGSKSASIKVYVERFATSIKVTSDELDDCFGNKHSMKIGEEIPLIVNISPSNATHQDIEWSVDNDVAVIDEYGVLTFKKEGTVKVTATNSKSRQAVSGEIIMVATAPITGDANNDENINVADVGAIGSYMTLEVPEERKKAISNFCFTNADVKKDGTIDVDDLNATIEIAMAILNGTYGTRSNTSLNMPEGDETLKINDFDVTAEDITIDFTLGNAGSYRILQADVRLTGLETVSVEKGEALSDHIIISNMNPGNLLKLVIFSFNNTPFQDNGQPLFHVKGKNNGFSGVLTAENIKVIGNDGIKYELGFDGGNPGSESRVEKLDEIKQGVYGGKGSITIAGYNGLKVNIYSVEGRLIKSQTLASEIESISISNGIYIINVGTETRKVTVK